MKYMLMLFEPETDWSQRPAELEAVLAEHAEFDKFLQSRGMATTGEALAGQSTATTLRKVGDEMVVTDPVCHMRVPTTGDATIVLEWSGRRFHFCGLPCVSRFAADPDRYLKRMST